MKIFLDGLTMLYVLRSFPQFEKRMETRLVNVDKVIYFMYSVAKDARKDFQRSSR